MEINFIPSTITSLVSLPITFGTVCLVVAKGGVQGQLRSSWRFIFLLLLMLYSQLGRLFFNRKGFHNQNYYATWWPDFWLALLAQSWMISPATTSLFTQEYFEAILSFTKISLTKSQRWFLNGFYFATVTVPIAMYFVVSYYLAEVLLTAYQEEVI